MYVGAGFLGGNWPDEAHHLQSGNTGYASYFNGNISDVALFSQYLTAPTVAALYATGHVRGRAADQGHHAAGEHPGADQL